MGELLSLPNGRGVVDDIRGRTRALQVSAHPRQRLVVLSVWRDGACAATVRLTPAETADLIGSLAASLSAAASVDAEDGPASRP